MTATVTSVPFKVGVIISTYNNPAWLEKTLWSYQCQSYRPDEIIIADDGSGKETSDLIQSFCGVLPIRHVWHEDRGFEKTKILNKAIVASTADYLIFTDQDLLARKDFVETHVRYARRGRFLSGGTMRLPMDISLKISREDIESGVAFELKWLKRLGFRPGFKGLKMTGNHLVATLMNHITPAGATWNGGNASGWKDDLIAVNGFNEELHYGGEDRELGQRLENMGLKPKQLRYSAVTLHLDHKRPYKNPEEVERNRQLRKALKRSGQIRTPHGINGSGQ